MAKIICRVAGERMQRVAERVQDDLRSLVALLKDEEGPYESPHFEVRENVYEAITALETAIKQIVCRTDEK